MYKKERYVMDEIVRKLNEFLCNLEVFNVKLQNYHWNVNGNDMRHTGQIATIF